MRCLLALAVFRSIIAVRRSTSMSAMKPLFLADWIDAFFVHFALDPADLQPLVGMKLDTFNGRAWVSLVAFTQTRLRFAATGDATWLTRPLSDHPFLNLRTYVRDGDERGIFFMAEWIPNRLAVLLGPAMYGLPYRLGRLQYRHHRAAGRLHSNVRAGGSSIEMVGSFNPTVPAAPAKDHTLDAFLLERYTAFTIRRGVRRSFRVAHEPWLFHPVQVSLPDTSLLELALPSGWGLDHPACAHYSSGVVDVGIDKPRRRSAPPRRIDCQRNRTIRGAL
jgi:uncharacterized protein YqjF (DUF2071 family)